MVGSEVSRAVARTAPLFGLLLAVLVAATMIGTKPAWTATTFTVNDNGDDYDINLSNSRCDGSTGAGDQCTLRAAIEEANDTSGADTIDFDIGSGSVAKTISPATELPPLTDTVTINGYTQRGASPNTLDEGNDADFKVRLDGDDAVSSRGLQIEADDCTIKGLVIKRFDSEGIVIVGAGTGNRIEGNFVGVNSDGITGQGNGDDGVYILSDSNTVGGSQPESRNVISGNEGRGIFLGAAASENTVEGNYVGTTAAGTADLGNAEDGVAIQGQLNTVGGTAAGARNLISGNDQSGVSISRFGATENRIEGNYVGTAADGLGDLGNALDGVAIEDSAASNVVGGAVKSAGNRIVHNGANGVSVTDSGTVYNYILSNSIHDNAELGIDLVGGTEGVNGVTANDRRDSDLGPNRLQNFPVILSAKRKSSTSTTTIFGNLDSTPFGLFEVQCFLTDRARASAHGEGSLLLDTSIVSTDDEGNGGFSCESRSKLVNPASGQMVSATATNLLTGGTSEFSKNKAIATGP